LLIDPKVKDSPLYVVNSGKEFDAIGRRIREDRKIRGVINTAYYIHINIEEATVKDANDKTYKINLVPVKKK